MECDGHSLLGSNNLYFLGHSILHQAIYFMAIVTHPHTLSVDVNECERGTDLCQNARCVNTIGSYTCGPCFAGFNVSNATTCSKSYCVP